MSKNLEQEIISAFKEIVGKKVQLEAQLRLDDECNSPAPIQYIIKNKLMDAKGSLPMIKLGINSPMRYAPDCLVKKADTISAIGYASSELSKFYFVSVNRENSGAQVFHALLDSRGSMLSIDDTYSKGTQLIKKEDVMQEYKEVFKRALEVYRGLKKEIKSRK